EATTVDGKPLKLADLRGKVVLVDVWGTWCPPCRAEIPHLIELYEKLSPKGFAIVGFNVERVPADKAPQVVKDFIAEKKIPYLDVVADKTSTEKIRGFEGFPTMLLIDRQGRVRLKQVGYTEGPVLEAGVEKLLAEAAPAGGGAAPAGGEKKDGEKGKA